MYDGRGRSLPRLTLLSPFWEPTMHIDANHCARRLPLVLLAACLGAPAYSATPQIEQGENGPRVTIDGELFTEYRTDLGNKPILWPIIGPTGKEVTRGFPMREAAPGEAVDHVWHKSLWFGHERMNGVDFWLEPPTKQDDPEHGSVVDVGEPEMIQDADQAVLRCKRRWLAPGGAEVCRDTTTYRFGEADGRRWIDFEIEISPSDGPLTIGDAKDASFSMRVADSMRQEAGLGGTMVNDSGQRDAECWGQRAAWVDYSGPVDGERVGIAIMSHPTNARPRPRWHVRTYGLFAVNPFGEKQFPPIEGYKQGAVTVPEDGSLTLRYRALLHRGDAVEGEVASQFKDYAAH